jgi:hypothetical protein
LTHFITQSSFSFLFVALNHQVFLFLSLCHTSSPSLPFKCGKEKGKEKEDMVMKYGKEKGKGRLGDDVWQRERKRQIGYPVFLFLSLCHTSSPSLPFPFSLTHFITQSSFSFLFVTLHHQVFLFLSLCHTSSPSLPFPLKKNEKGRLGDEVWQRKRKRKTD